MGTDHKEKLIRVLQILEETDEKSPMNATQILKYLEEEYQIEQVDRRSVYRDIKMLQKRLFPLLFIITIKEFLRQKILM